MELQPARRVSWGKVAIIAAVASSIAFGAFVVYFEFTNDSFPLQERPFSDYASVVSTSFNGTELAYNISWHSAGYYPLYAQVTSPTSDQANTPVCDIQFSAGRPVYMPFTIAQPSQGLTSVDLSISVRPVGGGGDFTIVYHLDSVSLTGQGDLHPTDLACQQPSGAM